MRHLWWFAVLGLCGAGGALAGTPWVGKAITWHRGPAGIAVVRGAIQSQRLISSREARAEIQGLASGSRPAGLSGRAASSSLVPELALRLTSGQTVRYPVLASSYPPGTEPLRFTDGEAMLVEYRPGWPALRVYPAAPGHSPENRLPILSEKTVSPSPPKRN